MPRLSRSNSLFDEFVCNVETQQYLENLQSVINNGIDSEEIGSFGNTMRTPRRTRGSNIYEMIPKVAYKIFSIEELTDFVCTGKIRRYSDSEIVDLIILKIIEAQTEPSIMDDKESHNLEDCIEFTKELKDHYYSDYNNIFIRSLLRTIYILLRPACDLFVYLIRKINNRKSDFIPPEDWKDLSCLEKEYLSRISK
jgi:hypothetical protein